MAIKTSFSIKDLENLSGIKAHTIRIWEKRYNLLRPERSDTNIRNYDTASLQKLLNVSLLLQHGHKISKVAALEENELHRLVRELGVESENTAHALHSFKLAMLNFDQPLFDQTFNQLLTQNSFRDIFLKVFIKLLDEIGVLWLTDTIIPAQEHFISNLIKQKLLINIERVQHGNFDQAPTYILFLPYNEIHELGLMYIHFEILLKGHRSIYLGPSVPTTDLVALQSKFSNVTYISYLTVEPEKEKLDEFLQDFSSSLLFDRGEKLFILGRNTHELDKTKVPESIEVFPDIVSLIDSI